MSASLQLRLLVGLAGLAALSASAAENNQVRALLGAPSYELATPQFPGVYAQFWYQHYSADKLRDNNGDEATRTAVVGGQQATVKLNTKVRADVLVPRVTWITEQLVADGRLGFSASLPIVRQRTTVRPTSTLAIPQFQQQLAASAQSNEETGQSDLELTAFVDWQQESSRVAAGLAVVAPTGDYEHGRAVNPGTGKYWTFRPLVVASYVFENGLQLGTRATYSFNTTNRDSDVRSGQYLHADWAAVYPVADLWRVGLQGFVLTQTTDDRGPNVADDGNKARTFGAGPTVGYLSETGLWAVDMKVMQEFEVRNRPEGWIGWLRLNMRFE